MGTLYIVDDDDNLHEHHVQSGSWTKWVVHNRAWSLSTSHAGDVLVTSRTSRLLLEYAPGGCLRLTVRLPADVVNPNHAMRVTSDQLAICHGDMTDETQRICIVSNCGEVLKSCKVLANCLLHIQFVSYIILPVITDHCRHHLLYREM